MLPFIKFSRFY